MKLIRYLLSLLFALWLYPMLTAQNSTADSLKKLLGTNLPDTSYVQTALDLAWTYMYSETDSAVKYAQIALRAARAGNYKLKTASAYNTLGVCFIVKAGYYKALSYLASALETGKMLMEEDPGNATYKRRVLAIYTNTGNIYYYKGEYDKSIDNYFQALKLAEEIGYNTGIAVNSSNLAASYKDLLNYPKALEYNYKALAIAKKTGNSYSLSQSMNNLGSVYFSTKDYDSAYSYFFRSKEINEREGNEYELINNYVNLADVLRETERYDSSLYYYNLSVGLCRKLNSVDGLINCNYMIGQLYQKQGLLDKSADYFKESLRMATESGTSRFIMLSNEELAKVYRKKGDYKKALAYFTAGSRMRDSIFTAESDARIAEMETKYQTEKKEEEIRSLKEKTMLQAAQSRTNRIILVAVIIIFALIIFLVFISFRSFKLKQLAEKRLMQQHAERKVLDAVMETEFRERKRFAEDLHDGLGVLLSTLKLYIGEMKSETSRQDRKTLTGQINNLLDEAIKNARNISNNIMPAVLKNNGLNAAIRSFSDKINASGKVRITIHPANQNKRHKPTIEITLYRIITELINNTLKHAEATNIEILMTEKNNKLFMTYRDDGKGFDYKKMDKSGKKGMGFENIKSRLGSINGKYTFNTAPGKGFFAGIEVPLG
ncbi:MAG: tetratricopeptide repeat protein [Chlorobi bacterium]|nr:tetratricopeptide repeat protein [Chlorobiota bacterium]